ncbi:hypothetical protein, partial [Micromonospora psammae]|uniref:hypothetical protein n=1 Tax=Micromonospora sp. CPCC 205556 TaxID=3122398 RepID=UPI002FEE7CE3
MVLDPERVAACAGPLTWAATDAAAVVDRAPAAGPAPDGAAPVGVAGRGGLPPAVVGAAR